MNITGIDIWLLHNDGEAEARATHAHAGAQYQTAEEVIRLKQSEEKEQGLKGTFASVMLLGAFIVVSWLGVFVLYLSRN